MKAIRRENQLVNAVSCGVRMGQQETGEKRGEVQGRECSKLVILLSVTYHGQHALPA